MNQTITDISIQTYGEGFTDITREINNWISLEKLIQGIIVISVKHTSCSLTINENADPKVLKDLSAYFKSIVPEEGIRSFSTKGDTRPYLHSDEGSDDMPAHIRTALTCTSISLSITQGKLSLGTWQAVYLWEHRSANQLRTIALHAIGTSG